MTSTTPTPPCLGEREAVARTIRKAMRGTCTSEGAADMIVSGFIEPLRTENETLRAEVARLTDIALGDDAKAIAEYEWERANKLVAERDAAIARAEEAERRLGQRPLTASDLAEALECFSNPVVSAMHSGTATECCIAQGMDAVAWRLREMDRLAALTTQEHPHGD